MNADYSVSNHGSLFLFEPQNDDADAHLRASVSDEAQWWGGALAVECRYARDLVAALQVEGFAVV